MLSDERIPRRQTKYLELSKNANQIAQTILNNIKETNGNVNDDGDWIIAVCMKPSDDLITVLLAIWKAGAAYLPIDVEYPEDRIKHIISEANPALVIYDNLFRNSDYFLTKKSIKFGTLKEASSSNDYDDIPDEATLNNGKFNSMAVVLYTSGSTGIPKGVRLSHYKVNQRNQWQLRKYPFRTTEKNCVFKTAMTFVDHIGEIWCPLIAGRTLIVIPKATVKNPEKLVPILEEFTIERILGVPTLLRSILMYLNNLTSNKTKFLLMQLRTWISSGEPLTKELAEEFFEYFDGGHQKLVNFYGSTEVCSDASSFEITSVDEIENMQKIPLGKPIDNTTIYVLDEKQNVVDEGVIGEIYCANELVADGYIFGRDSERFSKNPLEPFGRKLLEPKCNFISQQSHSSFFPNASNG